jgi:hypothetical protein
MVQDLSQLPQGRTKLPGQAVCGVTPPSLREARIREAWPALVGVIPPLARLGEQLVRTVVLMPIGWGFLGLVFLLKFAPFVCRRYTLTNRRLMIQRGWKPHPVHEVKLEEIDDVRIVHDSVDTFAFSATLEVVHGGQVKLTLPGVPEPEGFRAAVMNAVKAWVPAKATAPVVPASATPPAGQPGETKTV